MWVIKDHDSTIYLFGTVHLLDPGITWQTPRVTGALEQAKQLWVEVNIPPGGELALGMAMLQKALSPGKPLSSRLSEAERAQLRKLLERTPNGPALAAVIEMTRPWFATVMLGVGRDRMFAPEDIDEQNTPLAEALAATAERHGLAADELRVQEFGWLSNQRRMVRLSDGRVGKVMRVDTTFPGNATTVSIWTDSKSPSVAKVSLTDIVGDADKQSA
jgi:hypothetical protein